MKGYPHTLNTRADFEYVMQAFPASYWLKDLKALLASSSDWFFVKDLESKEEGVEDATHKIVEGTVDKGTEQLVTYAQYELRENPTAKIFRIGFTVDEVKALVAGAEK